MFITAVCVKFLIKLIWIFLGRVCVPLGLQSPYPIPDQVKLHFATLFLTRCQTWNANTRNKAHFIIAARARWCAENHSFAVCSLRALARNNSFGSVFGCLWLLWNLLVVLWLLCNQNSWNIVCFKYITCHVGKRSIVSSGIVNRVW